MSNLSFFEFRSNRVRTTVKEGQVAFCLGDVLKAIGSETNASRAKSLIEDGFGDGVVIVHTLQTEGGIQNALFVFEAGLTFLLSRSRTEIGKQLNRLVHAEILPSLRKTGKYEVGQSSAIAPSKALSRREILQLALEAEDRAIESEEARIAAETAARTLQLQIEVDEPATTLGKAIAKAPNNLRIGDFAKSIGMGQNRYFAELRDEGIIQESCNLPYQRFLDAGHFQVTQIVCANGRTYPVALVTPKGQAYLVKRHNKHIDRQTVRNAIDCLAVAV